MGHGHHHHHHGHHSQKSLRALSWALLLNGGFLIIEAAAGWYTGSLALLSDAGHMLSDVAALVLALIALLLAQRASEGNYTFGWKRAEVLGGFVNALAMFGIAGFIVFEAFERLQHGAPKLSGMPILIVGAIGLVINLGSAYALYRADSNSLNIRGALAHMLADALGSVGAMISAVLVMNGIYVADTIISVVIAVLVISGTWGLLKDCTRVLLQGAPSSLDLEKIQSRLLKEPEIDSVHDLHAWSLDGDTSILTAHICSQEKENLESTCMQVQKILREEFSIEHATLQMESVAAPCPVQEHCNLTEGSHAH